MNKSVINELRQAARKLIRELGMLKLNMSRSHRTPQHWHTLIEIANEPNITTTKLGKMLLLSSSSMSRIVNALQKDNLITYSDGADKREKHLEITQYGLSELKKIDEFSVIKIKGALEFLNEVDQHDVIVGLQKYADALEKSRLMREQIKIHTLSTSRIIRKQIINMIENIQKNEFNLSITDDINSSILRAEEEFYCNRSYNFWYAVDQNGKIIGSIGLKMIDSKNAELKKFFVDKEYRGKNVAFKLLKTFLKSAIKNKFKNIYLGTVDVLHAAHRFYEKHGFLPINETELPSNFDKCPIDTVFFKISVKNLESMIESFE
jgi:DNA-binding MarR family transcriptional regulator/N-acetylglutamate synthase-like GNAT family acetyltransferase